MLNKKGNLLIDTLLSISLCGICLIFLQQSITVYSKVMELKEQTYEIDLFQIVEQSKWDDIH